LFTFIFLWESTSHLCETNSIHIFSKVCIDVDDAKIISSWVCLEEPIRAHPSSYRVNKEKGKSS